jgi:FMN-dependent NADH-azoreductase
VKTLLQINSSLFSMQGQSTLLADRFVEKWKKENPDGKVIVRDLASKPVPHLTGERFQALLTEAGERTAEQAAFAAESDHLIEELESADAIVLGLPMYNFGIPSTLKAWIDHIARAGKTFKYTANGPVGLLADRPVHIFATRGGYYEGTPMDTQSAYMTHFLNFIGIHDMKFIYAEGLAKGEDNRRESLSKASRVIERIAA